MDIICYSFRTQRNALNLDVTAMMAYVSSSTNGGCYATIDSVILADQAKREQSHHVKEMLDNIFEGLLKLLAVSGGSKK